MAEIDQEGEILPDGTLSVYVNFILKIWLSSKGFWFNYISFLTLEKYNLLELAGTDNQFQLFTSGLATHQKTILQNQWDSWIQFFSWEKLTFQHRSISFCFLLTITPFSIISKELIHWPSMSHYYWEMILYWKLLFDPPIW